MGFEGRVAAGRGGTESLCRRNSEETRDEVARRVGEAGRETVFEFLNLLEYVILVPVYKT